MDQELSSTDTEKKTRKPRYNAEEHIKALEERLENVEKALVKITSLTGQGNHLAEFGYSMWTPGKKDMQKYK